MAQHAVDCAAAAFEKFRIEEDIAKFIKTEFDIMYHPSWHCIVGKSFGSYIAHQTNHMIYFYIGEVAVLLWHSVQKPLPSSSSASSS